MRRQAAVETLTDVSKLVTGMCILDMTVNAMIPCVTSKEFVFPDGFSVSSTFRRPSRNAHVIKRA